MIKVDKHMDPQVEDDLKRIYGSPLPDVFSSPLPKYLGEDYWLSIYLPYRSFYYINILKIKNNLI